MSERRYKFDPKSATFVPAKKTLDRYFFDLFLFLSTAFTFGLLFAFLLFPHFSNPDEQLEKELENMEVEFQIMNDRLNESQKVLENLKERDRNIYRAYFDLATVEDSLSSKKENHFDGYQFGDLMNATDEKVKKLSLAVINQSKSLDEILQAAKKQEEAFEHIPAIQPIANKELKRLSSGFGVRIHPILKIGKMHWGMDFKADSGTPIYATGDATVETAGTKGGYGRTVVLNHGFGYKTLYAHMSRIQAKEGQKVKRGDIIGFVGNTGMSSGTHLHYEVHKNGKKINPITFFSGEISPDDLKKLYEESEKTSFSFD